LKTLLNLITTKTATTNTVTNAITNTMTNAMNNTMANTIANTMANTMTNTMTNTNTMGDKKTNTTARKLKIVAGFLKSSSVVRVSTEGERPLGILFDLGLVE
jgi:hypothetical protein